MAVATASRILANHQRARVARSPRGWELKRLRFGVALDLNPSSSWLVLVIKYLFWVLRLRSGDGGGVGAEDIESSGGTARGRVAVWNAFPSRFGRFNGFGLGPVEGNGMGEQGGPEQRVAAIGVGAANEFVASIGQPDELSLAKLADECGPRGPTAPDDGFEV